MKPNNEFKSRFRILKGGKISLVVSALLVGGALITPTVSNAGLVLIENATTTAIDFGQDDFVTITGTGKVEVAGGDDAVATNQINETVTNSGTISTTSSGYHAIDAAYLFGSIVNNASGSITAQDNAIEISGFGTDSTGTITNAGTITSTHGHAINISDSGAGVFEGTITNSGNLYGRVRGISIKNLDAGTITNTDTGLIQVHTSSSGDSVGGIVISASSDDASGTKSLITNAGTINATADDGGATGIAVAGTSAYTTITNSGQINASGVNFSLGISAGQIYNTNIINSGTINAITTDAGSSVGIFISQFINDPSNNSTITNSGSIDITNNFGDAFGITTFNNLRGGIINEAGATIDVEVTGANNKAYGISISKIVYSGSNITNSGTVNVTSADSEAIGIEINKELLGELTNAGIINVNGGSFAKAISLEGYLSNANVTNSGTITATLNNEASKYAYSLSSPSDGDSLTFTNTSTGTLNGNIYFSGTLTNAGTISLPHDATAEMNIFTNSGILKIGLQTDGTTTTFSKVDADTATFNTGSKLYVNVLSTSTNQNLLAGETLQDVVTANTLTINDLTVDDNSALLNFEYVEDGETIDLNVIEGKTTFDSALLGGAQTHTKKSARVLQNINDNISQYSQMTPIMAALNALETDGAVAQAVESTAPQTAGAATGAGGQISRGIASIVTQRQNINMGGTAGGLNSGDEMFAEKNFWFKPFGSFGKQNNKDGINGFDLKSYGFGIGVDGEYKSNQSLGVAFFYTRANVDMNNVSQEADLDVFTTLVYGNVPVIDEKTKFLYQLGYSWQKTDSKRDVFTGSTATSDYTANVASLDLKLMRDYTVNEKLLLQPIVETTYRYFKTPGYSESGAGALNLSTDASTTTELIAGVGTLAHYKLDQDSKLTGNINVGYDLHDKQQSVTSSFQGASSVSFDTDGIDNGRWSYDVGFGYERDIDESSNINVSYNKTGEGSDFSNNTISAKYLMKF